LTHRARAVKVVSIAAGGAAGGSVAQGSRRAVCSRPKAAKRPFPHGHSHRRLLCVRR